MVPTNLRDVAGFLFVATLSAFLYRYWLIMPVLAYVTFNEWRAIAILATLAVGGVWPLFKQNVLTLVVGFLVGIVISGTWLEWRANDALPTSLGFALQSHLESFWPDVIMLTFAVMLGGYCSAHLMNSRASH